jgi:hypothetical protein
VSRQKRNKRKRISGEADSTPRDPFFNLMGRRFTRIETIPPTVIIGKVNKPGDLAKGSLDYQTKKALHSILGLLLAGVILSVLRENRDETVNPPKNAELLLLLIVRSDERDAVVGDLIERYRRSHERLGRKRADLYAYGEVCRSLVPFIRRLLFGTGLILLLGQWIKKLIS